MGVSPQQAAQNWSNGMQGAGAKIKAGIQAVTTSPTQLAAAASDRYQQGVLAAVASGKFAANLQAVSLQSWQQSAINKGIPRIAAGASAAVGKMQNFLTQFLPFINGVVAQLPPRGDLQTNINRAVSVMQGAANFKYQKPTS